MSTIANWVPIAITVGGSLLSVGAAYGGARVALNGTKRRVQVIEQQLFVHDDRVRKQGEDIAAIRAKVDLLVRERA